MSERVTNPLVVPTEATNIAPPRCAYIATKTDYYRDPSATPPSNPGSGATAIWWCVLTSKSLGPDEGPCNREDCNAARACYQPTRRRHPSAD